MKNPEILVVGIPLVLSVFVGLWIHGRIAVRLDNLIARLASLKIIADDTHRQMETYNELTLGQLGADAETRRIEEKPEGDRTAKEGRHLVDMEERDRDAED